MTKRNTNYKVFFLLNTVNNYLQKYGVTSYFFRIFLSCCQVDDIGEILGVCDLHHGNVVAKEYMLLQYRSIVGFATVGPIRIDFTLPWRTTCKSQTLY